MCTVFSFEIQMSLIVNQRKDKYLKVANFTIDQ